jgi:hypothetical protein
MRVLQMISSAYRATIEEQDDTILWLTQAMKAAGAEIDVVLSGHAVNYAVAGQEASGLAFGGWKQSQPPRIDDDLARMIGKGVAVLAVAEDLADHGLNDAKMVGGVRRIPRHELPRLMDGYDRVWRW